MPRPTKSRHPAGHTASESVGDIGRIADLLIDDQRRRGGGSGIERLEDMESGDLSALSIELARRLVETESNPPGGEVWQLRA